MLISQARARARENDLVLKAFTVLTRKDALARQLSRLDVQQVRPCRRTPAHDRTQAVMPAI